MSKKKILIIDDDEKINSLLSEYLSKFNYITVSATHPDDGFKILSATPPDLVILDIMLPDMDGYQVCRMIRETSDVPIIMLTARGDVADKVVGLELGADDYLSKPFEPRELVARIQAILKRTEKSITRDSKKFGDIEIDYKTNTVKIKGEEIFLTTLEFYALKYFSHNPGVVISRNQLYEKLKGYDDESFDRSIDVMISRLRKKLGDDPNNPRYIKTIWGTGYKFIK